MCNMLDKVNISFFSCLHLKSVCIASFTIHNMNYILFQSEKKLHLLVDRSWDISTWNMYRVWRGIV